MASFLHNRGAFNLATGVVAWGTSDLRVLLTTSAYVPSRSHNTVSQVTDELSLVLGNYVRKALANEIAVQDDAGNRVLLTADDVIYTALQAAAGTPRYAIVYLEAASDLLREIVGTIDLGAGAQTPNGNDYEVQWDAVVGMFRHNTA